MLLWPLCQIPLLTPGAALSLLLRSISWLCPTQHRSLQQSDGLHPVFLLAPSLPQNPLHCCHSGTSLAVSSHSHPYQCCFAISSLAPALTPSASGLSPPLAAGAQCPGCLWSGVEQEAVHGPIPPLYPCSYAPSSITASPIKRHLPQIYWDRTYLCTEPLHFASTQPGGPGAGREEPPG